MYHTVGYFHGVQMFVNLYIALMYLWKITECMPWNNQPTKSSYLPKPQNCKPSKVTNCTVAAIVAANEILCLTYCQVWGNLSTRVTIAEISLQ